MLSALLTSIQGSLSAVKGFIISSLLPVLLFVLANGVMFHRVSVWFRELLSSSGITEATTVTGATIGISFWGFVYVFSALNTTFLAVLEGKHLSLAWFTGSLHARQWRKLQRLEAQYERCIRQQGEIERRIKPNPTLPSSLLWVQRLDQAQNAGNGTNACGNYPSTSLERWWAIIRNTWGMRPLHKILQSQKYGRFVSYNELEEAVTGIEVVLTQNASNLDSQGSKALRQACQDLLNCIYYARDKYQFERIRLYNMRQFTFPGSIAPPQEDRSSLNILAPTTMGNIGRTMRSYALTRYALDLDLLWTRLQKTLQNSRDFSAVLQESKIQVDFMVALCWLTILFTIIWGAVLPFVSLSYIDFLAIGIGGPLLAFFWYRLACHRYSIFADIVRSTVDLYRFELLKDLRIPLPNGSEDEKQLWHRLGNITGYGQHISLTYKHS